MSAQGRDTAAVLRQLGWRRIAGALLRRAGSHMRGFAQAGAARQPPSAAAFESALRNAPSLVVGHAQFSDPPVSPGDLQDPRARWEGKRGGDLAAMASRRDDNFELALLAYLAEPPENDPLETAVRAWNLGVAASLHGWSTLGDMARRALAVRLVESGRIIESRLEDRGLVCASHLVGELVGLEVCGLLLGGAGREPDTWRSLARTGLAREARIQVLPDGGGIEGSSGYGRFVAELWIAAIACARAAGEKPSPSVAAAARGMLVHLADTLPPDGDDLNIGDNDSSIVLPGATNLASVIPLLALWSLAERPAGLPWSAVAENIGGAAARARWEAAREVTWRESVWQPHFGLALARRGGLGGDMVAMRAGSYGQYGVGGHGHNDALSVSIWLDGRRIVVDPGSGVYLGRPALRDRFRGVAAHATVCVDGLEPSQLPATRPFALPDTTQARIVSVEDQGGVWRCVAEHVGYLRTGVRVRREVRFERATGDIEIVDTLEGSGFHRIDLSFPFATTDAKLDGDSVVTGDVHLRAGAADVDKRLAWRLDEGSISPRYGAVEPALVARRGGRVELPVTLVTQIARKR